MELLNPRQVAAMLGMPYRKVAEMMSRGILPCVRVRNRLYSPRSALEAWMNQQVAAALAGCAECAGRENHAA